MKKIKNLLTLLLVAMIGCLVLIGCNGESTESATSEKNNNINDKNVVLADFEEWAPDFQLLKLREEFGAIDVNKDTQYVKSGKQSAKLYVMGWEVGTQPYFFIPTYSELFQFDYTNFNSVDSVSVWIYNPSQESVKMGMGLVMENVSVTTASLSKQDYFTLENGWNNVVYCPDMSYIISSVGFDEYEGVQGIYFLFEKTGASYKKDAPYYYMDDVVINYGQEKEIISVKAGTYYVNGSFIGDSHGLVFKKRIDMEKLVGKALHFEFKFGEGDGVFGFDIMASDWANITGNLRITKKDNVVTSNIGRIVDLGDGWYAWELNHADFKGDGAFRARDVGMLYHQNFAVNASYVEIDWRTLSVVDAYTEETN